MRNRAPLRTRLLSGTPLIGTFVKIPHPQIVELLAGTKLDFVVLDAEHAAFGTAILDQCLMAARLTGLPALVRVAALDKAAIGAALDMGAAGVVIPHVATVETAEEAVRAAQYAEGVRGISGAHRAASYGCVPLADYARAADAETVIVAQLEDAAALETIGAMAAVERIDAFFIGRTDLTLSLGGYDPDAAAVDAAVAALETAIRAAGKALGTLVGRAGQIDAHVERGYRLLAVGTDQALLTAGANALVSSGRR